jgi:hypothetical protein
MAKTTLAVNEQARDFRLDPDSGVEITCPWCHETISTSGPNIFHAGAEVGEPLNGDATLGDLIDAASKHVCDEDDHPSDAAIVAGL